MKVVTKELLKTALEASPSIRLQSLGCKLAFTMVVLCTCPLISGIYFLFAHFTWENECSSLLVLYLDELFSCCWPWGVLCKSVYKVFIRYNQIFPPSLFLHVMASLFKSIHFSLRWDFISSCFLFFFFFPSNSFSVMLSQKPWRSEPGPWQP